jgi:hypothetical protein
VMWRASTIFSRRCEIPEVGLSRCYVLGFEVTSRLHADSATCRFFLPLVLAEDASDAAIGGGPFDPRYRRQ